MRVKISVPSAKKRALDEIAVEEDPPKALVNASLTVPVVEQQQQEPDVANYMGFAKRVRIELPKISSSSVIQQQQQQQQHAQLSSSVKPLVTTSTTLFQTDNVFSTGSSSSNTEVFDEILSGNIAAFRSTAHALVVPSAVNRPDEDNASQHSSINTFLSAETGDGLTAAISSADAQSSLLETAHVTEYYEPDVVLPPVTNSTHGFYRLLAYYIRWLQRQDKKQLFHHPVTEALAPGYACVIQTPMDFETMSLKLQAGSYTYIAQFMADFHLLCWNATKYNKPTTNIYRAAKMLLASGKRAFGGEKIDKLKRNKQFSYIRTIERGRLNFHRYDLNAKRPYAPQLPGIGLTDTSGTENASSTSSRALQQPNHIAKPFEAIPDNMTPEEVLHQVRQKARTAARAVRQQSLQVNFGFIESYDTASAISSDGSDAVVTLRIVNPGHADAVERREQVSLGVLAGRVPPFSSDGYQSSFLNTSPVAGFYRNFSQPSQAAHDALFSTFYGSYNAYSSALPYFDRRESVFTREELSELRSVYKRDRGLQYSEAMLRFARSSHPRVRTIIEHHLNKMTDKSAMRHSELISALGARLEQRRKHVNDEIRQRASATVKCDRLLDITEMSADEKLLAELSTAASQAKREHAGFSVNTLHANRSNAVEDLVRNSAAVESELDFVDRILRESNDEAFLSDADVQKALDLNAEVLFALYMQQTARLSEQYDTVRAVPFSTEMERELADLSVGLFKRLVRRASPEDVVSVQALRHAMGLPGIDDTKHLSAQALLDLVRPPTVLK